MQPLFHPSVRAFAAAVCVLLALSPAASGRNYVRSLVGNLIEIGYPVSTEDVLALDKIAMRFDGWNRLDVLSKLLSDRDKIHGMEGADYFKKTEAIRCALHLLDEHNLPEANALIEALSRQGGWEKREKALLTYMAAKRGIDYAQNAAYLLGELPEYGGSAEESVGLDVSAGILDFSNTLSYLSGLFSHTGDVRIGNALIRYTARAYGYPAEYASRLLVDMCLQQPGVFLSLLAKSREKTRRVVIDAIVFGIWNNQQKENVFEAVNKDLLSRNDREKDTITLLNESIKRKFPCRPADGNDPKIGRDSKK